MDVLQAAIHHYFFGMSAYKSVHNMQRGYVQSWKSNIYHDLLRQGYPLETEE